MRLVPFIKGLSQESVKVLIELQASTPEERAEALTLCGLLNEDLSGAGIFEVVKQAATVEGLTEKLYTAVKATKAKRPKLGEPK